MARITYPMIEEGFYAEAEAEKIRVLSWKGMREVEAPRRVYWTGGVLKDFGQPLAVRNISSQFGDGDDLIVGVLIKNGDELQWWMSNPVFTGHGIVLIVEDIIGRV